MKKKKKDKLSKAKEKLSKAKSASKLPNVKDKLPEVQISKSKTKDKFPDAGVSKPVVQPETIIKVTPVKKALEIPRPTIPEVPVIPLEKPIMPPEIKVEPQKERKVLGSKGGILKRRIVR